MKKHVLLGFLVSLVVPGTGLAQVINQKVVDGGGSGPYSAIAATEATLPDYVVYRPDDIAAAAAAEGGLPVLAFANGGCSNTSITHERVLSEIASHGYLVVAIGALQMTRGERESAATEATMLTDALDWLADRNADPDSEYREHVALDRIALGGQSCGGAQILAVAADPRIDTYVMFNSGMGDMSMAGASAESLESVHGPIVYIIGGPSDVAFANAEGDYERIDEVPVAFADLTEGGHMGTFGEEYGGSFAHMALAWLDWQLKGEDDGAPIFLEGDLAEFSGWTMKSKNFEIGQAATFTIEDDGQWQTASNADRVSEFPKMHPDGRVWFRYEAPPTAESVELSIDGESHDMQTDADGLWNVVIPGAQPGFRIYSFVVDGVSIPDPGSTPYFMGGNVSALEYPSPDDDFYALRHVPHGDVRQHWFYSDVAGEFRSMFVYTPPGYDEDTNTRYPVVYLQHGGGEVEDEWVNSGRANFILDNLLAEGNAQPMIIVMNNGFVTRAEGADEAPAGGYGPGFAAAFEDMLLDEVIPDVDATYRTLPDSEHRALAGLSMGGGQTFYIGLENTDVFGSLGVFGSGLFGGLGGGGGEPEAFDAEAHIPGLLTRAESFNEALDLFYVSVGEQDPRLEASTRAVELFREHGLDVEFGTFQGAHEWRTWRSSWFDFAQHLFQ